MSLFLFEIPTCLSEPKNDELFKWRIGVIWLIFYKRNCYGPAIRLKAVQIEIKTGALRISTPIRE